MLKSKKRIPGVWQITECRERFRKRIMLTKREQFLLLVFSGALAHDLANNTTDAQAIAQAASAINEDKIPPNANGAARVFLRFFHSNRTMPLKWMLIGAEHALEKV